MIDKSLIQGDIPTNKSAYRTMYDIAWPSVLEAVLISIIASVDTIMVGGIGSHAIAAVGITAQPKYIVLAIILSLNIGVTAVVSRRKGENNFDGANACFKQALIICTGLSILMAIAGYFFADDILSFAGAGDDILDMAVSYFRITMIGNVFQSLALTINAAQRGIGNTKISMHTNIAANIINLIFNFFLINGIWFFPKLGTNGAAIATVMGNIVAFTLAMISVSSPHGFLSIVNKVSWKFKKATLSTIVKISSNAMMEQVFIRVGVFVNTMLIANLGTSSLATYQISMNVLSICFCVGDGISMASSSLAGQSLGAKRQDIAIVYGKVGQRIALVIGVLLFFLLYILRNPIAMLFTNESDIIAVSAYLIIITGLIGPFMASNGVFMGVLRGAGDVKYTAAVSLISFALIRPVTTYLFCYPMGLGVIGAWYSIALDQVIKLLLVGTRFYTGKWTKISL